MVLVYIMFAAVAALLVYEGFTLFKALKAKKKRKAERLKQGASVENTGKEER